MKKLFILIAIVLSAYVSSGFAAERRPVRITPTDVEQALDLKAREEAVVLKEKEILAKEGELVEVQKEINTKLKSIADLQAELKVELEQFNAVKTKEFKNLIKIYSAMSASKVAPLLNKMDDKAVVKILRAMKSDLVAKIIPKLDLDKAVAASRRLGLMNRMEK